MEAAQTRRAQQQAEQREREPLSGPEAITSAAKGESQAKGLTPDERSSALDWFLSEDPDEGEPTKTVEINVGTPDKENFVPWTIRAVDLDTLRRIRRQVSGSRAQRRSGMGEIDEVQANLRIVVEGTVEPDLVSASKTKGIADPATALRMRFAFKPGLIGQIAAEIMSLSGYDDEDVREVAAVRNS